MERRPNTTMDGWDFTYDIVERVWQKGQRAMNVPLIAIADVKDRASLKQDQLGKLIKRSEYGKTNEYGWEIDHIKPVSLGGSDEIYNLQPLHWENNRRKGDNYPF